MRCGIWCRLSALAAAALLAGCDGGSGQPRAEGAWVRLPAVAGRPAAAYVTLRGGREAVKLKTMQVPAARRVELHRSMSDGGMMSMTPIDRIDVPAGGTVSLEPGGMHAMLFDLDPALKAGGTTRMTLMFDRAPAIELEATLVAPGGAKPE
ncbi:copper chaperone PCu(A)C [Sphingomonas spermidinifaciens]|nr:copper chaperone PCu(A)C [Sphingomonas spermidinifaciens]